ncbi:MAG: RsmB/NOP family class I SAM-dependent RNA methyltransferase [Roseobacter sp.]
MTPAARVAAAIAVLDAVADGLAAEQALTRWGRQNRYAGSKDRAAVRDHVFDALRVRASAQWLGSGLTGRAMMIGLMRHQGADPEETFTAEGYAPTPLTPEERAFSPEPMTQADRWNIPDWLMKHFSDSLGDAAQTTADLLQQRAPVTVRAHRRRTTRSDILSLLRAEGIEAYENDLSENAITLGDGARKLRNTNVYQSGLVELQDAASQAVVDALPHAFNCLDFCAGGGGKALALAAQNARRVSAHDANPNRMKDLSARATRAGDTITQLTTAALADHAPFDLVLCDAPCSGSGAWRRAPEGKWALTQERLDELTETQFGILQDAARLVAPQGVLAYATCSILTCENAEIVARFLNENTGWNCTYQKQFAVSEQGDGFYTAHLTAP